MAGVSDDFGFPPNYESGYDVDENTFQTGPVDLEAGTYWLTLDDANATNAPLDFYWDVSQGPSAAFFDGYSLDGWLGGSGAESFQILGEPNSSSIVPELSGLIPAGMGPGLVGLLLVRRRRVARRTCKHGIRPVGCQSLDTLSQKTSNA